MPHLIVVIGIPGAGKSFFAHQFADMFHAPLLSEEVIVRSLSAESTLESRTSASNVLQALLPEFLKTGKTVLLDGSGAMRVERSEIIRAAKAAGYQPLFVWLQIDTPTAKMRSLKPARGTDKQPLTSDEFDTQLKKFSQPHPSEPYIVLSGKHTYAAQAKILLRKLSAPRAAQTVAPTAPPQAPKRPSTGNRISIS